MHKINFKIVLVIRFKNDLIKYNDDHAPTSIWNEFLSYKNFLSNIYAPYYTIISKIYIIHTMYYIHIIYDEILNI